MARVIPNTKPDPTPDAEVLDAPVPVEPEGVKPDTAEAPPVDPPEDEAPPEEVEEDTGRHEVFTATRPDGTVVTVDRNIDTGEQTVTDK